MRRERHRAIWLHRMCGCAIALTLGCGGGGAKPGDGGGDRSGDSANDAVFDVSADAASGEPGDPSADAAGVTGPGDAAGDAGGGGFPEVSPLGPSIPLDPVSCAGSWHVIYTPEPQELPPTRPDLNWRGSKLFVAHSSTQYSWVFSMPDVGGPRNLLYEGHLRSFWLEDDRLLYAQNYDLFSMPAGGGPPTNVLRYGGAPYFSPQDGDSLNNRLLDRDAIYWTTWDISGYTRVRKHARAGGEDVTLVSLTPEDTRSRSLSFVKSVGKDQMLLSFTGDSRESLPLIIAKSDGTRRMLPALASAGPNTGYGTLLNASNDGVLLWTRQDSPPPSAPGVGGPYYAYAMGGIDGTPPVPLVTQIARDAIATAAWPAGNGGWYVTTSERDPLNDNARYLSVWFTRADGGARRLACDPVTKVYASTQYPRTGANFVSAGVAGDGRLYLSVVRPDSQWVIASVENPGVPGETLDTGPPGPDAGAGDGGDAMGPDAGCPVAAPPVGPNALAEFAIPSPKSGPQFIVTGPDKNLWFNEVATDKLGRITPNGCITEFPISGYPSYAADITAGPDGNLWFTESGIDRIGRIEPDGMFLRQFRLSRGATGPRRIIAGPDGNLWFSQFSPSAIGRITTAGVVTSFPTAFSLAQPSALLVGPDGNIWFGEANAPKLGRINPADGTIVEFPIPKGGKAVALANASDGNIWMSEIQSSPVWVMAKVTMAGVVTEVPLPYSGVYGEMTKGPDGNLWFTEPPVGRIARLVPSTGELTEFSTSSPNSDPRGITTGPDGNLWFVESGIGKIGRLAP